jgi:hypothetical protein
VLLLDLPDTQARFRLTPWEPGSDNLHQAFSRQRPFLALAAAALSKVKKRGGRFSSAASKPNNGKSF